MMQLPPKKQNNTPKKSFSVKPTRKIVIISIVAVLVIFLLTRQYILSTQTDPLSTSRGFSLAEFFSPHLNDIAPNESITPQKQVSPSDGVSLEKEVTPSANDVFFGPIRLKGSSYINEQLKSYIDETATTSGTNEQKTDKNVSQVFSLHEMLTDPFKVVSKLSYSVTSGYMNSNKKTTLIKLIDAVSRYYVTYNKFPATDQTSYSWINEMVDRNEMSGVYSYVLETTSPVAYCGTVNQTGYCYNTDGQNAIIYVRIDPPVEEDICVDSGLFFLWSSEDNKFGELCMDNEPTQLSGFTFFPY